MAITSTATFRSPLSPDEVRARVAEYLESIGARVTAGEGSYVGDSGKKVAVRILGAFFVPRTWWPLRTEVQLAAADGGTDVTATVSDNFGLGIRTGMKTKYSELTEERLQALRAAIG